MTDTLTDELSKSLLTLHFTDDSAIECGNTTLGTHWVSLFGGSREYHDRSHGHLLFNGKWSKQFSNAVDARIYRFMLEIKQIEFQKRKQT